MPKLTSVTVTYGRKQSWQTQAGNWSSITIEQTATVEPDKGESSDVAALKAMSYCRHHVMAEMSGPFPALRPKLVDVTLDLEGQQALHSFDKLPEPVQQAMVENGINPDTFIYSFLPESFEAELKQGD